MKKLLTLLSFTLMLGIGYGQVPNGYYNNATGKTGDELKVALHNIIKNHTVISYAGLIDAYAYTDVDANGKIWDIYSNYHYSTSANVSNYKKEGDDWNREHTWPQSWFNEASGPKSDLFHVYPTDAYVNGRRSNYPYGEVSNPTYTSGNGSKLGPCVTSGYSGTVFEPVDEYKGDLARSYFYMSVRYYSEDSNWGSSDMTTKSVIKPWAMTMLLRWNDEDPVSQKEIDRNNVIYNRYQHNRNPFIDHPEYAHMIWDSNWTGGTSYNITCATGLSHGSVSAPSSALEGSTVAISATPNPGYMVDTYTVYKTGSPNTTVTVSSNGTFTMPDYAVTVSATFKLNNTYYTIALGEVTNGSISASATSALSGTTVNLTASPATGYSLYAWYVYKTGDQNTTVALSGNSFVMPSFNVTVRASFSQGTTDGDFVKVTSAPSDWSGEYLIVYTTGSLAFDGSLTSLDATNNTISVTISDNTIQANTTTNASAFTIAKSGLNYSIKSKSGFYIGQTSNSNGLASSTSTVYTNTLTYNNGDVDVVSSGGAYLRYNANSGQERFRYFKSGTYTSQQAIQLYKKTSTVAAPTHTIHFNSNGGSGSMNDQTVNENEPAALNTNAFSRSGYVFECWNTEADGSGTSYLDGADITLLTDVTLYAQWDQLFTLTCDPALSHGSLSVSLQQAVEGVTITLTATPATGYSLYACYAYQMGDPFNLLPVTDNSFEMPPFDVTVTASFVQGSANGDYVKVTTAPSDWSGEYLIVCESQNVAFNGTVENDWGRCSTVTINNHTIASSTITDAYKVTVSKVGTSGYKFLLPSGKYMNWTGEKKFSEGTTAQTYALSLSSGNVSITKSNYESNYTLKYNHNNGSGGLRSYQSGQTSIQLYKKTVATVIAPTHVIHFNSNGGSGLMSDQTVNENESTPLNANTFTRAGYVFESWNAKADGTGTSFDDGDDVVVITDVTLYAQWEQAVVEQSVTLAPGWNWWTPIIATNVGALQTAMGDNLLSIQSQSGTPSGDFIAGAMYKIQTANACSFTLSGVALSDVSVTIAPGLNWFGYPGMVALSIEDLGISPADGDKIVGQDEGFAIYEEGSGWTGTLGALQPGHGYVYLSNATESKTMILLSAQ